MYLFMFYKGTTLVANEQEMYMRAQKNMVKQYYYVRAREELLENKKSRKNLIFFAVFACQFKKKQYLCNRKCEMTHDSVAQLVEQLTLNQWVVGSSPTGVTESR